MCFEICSVIVWVVSGACCLAATSLILVASLRDYLEPLSGVSVVTASSLTITGITIIHLAQIFFVPATSIPTFAVGKWKCTIITFTIIPFTLVNILLVSFFAKYNMKGLELALEMVCVGHATFVEVQACPPI
jgi:hypothetical protein